MDISQFQAAVRLPRGADADQHQLRMLDCSGVIGHGAQISGAHAIGDQFLQTWFDDRAIAPVHQVSLHGIGIDPDYIVPVTCKARCRNDPHITESKDYNLHCELFRC